MLFNFGEDRRIPYLRFDCEEGEDLEQTANILGTLIEKTGLKVPTSYIYKKFSIPKPEGGEEIATPAQPAAPAYPFKWDAGREVALKGPAPRADPQQRVDKIADTAVKASAGKFGKLFSPVLKLIDNAETLEDLKRQLEDEELAEALLREMDAGDIEELLQRAMIVADLEGRAVELG